MPSRDAVTPTCSPPQALSARVRGGAGVVARTAATSAAAGPREVTLSILLPPQGAHGIDAGGAERGQPARRERDAEERERDRDVRRRITRPDAIEEGSHQPGQRERGDEPRGRA